MGVTIDDRALEVAARTLWNAPGRRHRPTDERFPWDDAPEQVRGIVREKARLVIEVYLEIVEGQRQ